MSEAGDSFEIRLEAKQAAKVADVPKTAEAEKSSLDAILIFGQGPIIEKETRGRAMDVSGEKGSEDINLWSKNLAEAAAQLYKRGQTREIIVMGGRTGGAEYSSEADLIAKTIEGHGVPSEAIKREDRSANTLENLVNVLNDYLDKDPQGKNLGILTANYHLPRTQMLMELFGIPYKTAFSAEEVLRYVAREKKEWDEQKLLEIERLLDMNEASKIPVSAVDKTDIYFQTKQGVEKKNIVKRGQEEDVWSRALLEVPAYWLGYLGRLNDIERVRQALARQDQQMLRDKFDIVLNVDTDDILRKKLLSIKREVPNPDEWVGQEWAGETQGKLQDLIDKRILSKEEEKEVSILVMRHAPTQWSKEHRTQGNVQTHIASEEEAKTYLENAGARMMQKPDVIVVSKLVRTAETAGALKKLLGWEDLEVVENPAFNERSWGILEGKTHKEVEQILLQDPSLLENYPYLKAGSFERIWSDPDFKVQGSESLNELSVRVKAGMLELNRRYHGKKVLLITHAGVLQTQGLAFDKISRINYEEKA